jgi:GNAT superfamily N-acetyltransferase
VAEIEIRTFTEGDAEALTSLLHRSYAELGRAGLNFTAVDQSVKTTVYRASGGHCLIAWDADRPVATLTMSMPPSKTMRSMFPAAGRDDLAWLNQMGVDPERRGEGLARRLWAIGRAWAIEAGAAAIGVDTAIPARHLADLYAGWGFSPVGSVHWEGKSYDSTVMLLELVAG